MALPVVALAAAVLGALEVKVPSTNPDAALTASCFIRIAACVSASSAAAAAVMLVLWVLFELDGLLGSCLAMTDAATAFKAREASLAALPLPFTFTLVLPFTVA